MKLLLVHPPIRLTEPPSHAPFGALQIAAVADALGHQVAVLDLNAFRIGIDAFRQEIRADKWDLVGISALSSQYQFVKQLLPVIREEHPDALIVGGGGGFSAQAEEWLRWLPELDVIVVGEGENTFVELLDVVYSKRFSEVRGLAYRDEKGEIKLTEPRPFIGMPDSGIFETLDDLPYPAWELAPVEVYLQNSRIPLCPQTMNPQLRRLSITHERGCPMDCRFCFHCAMSARDLRRIYKRKFEGWPVIRFPSAKYVVEHIKLLRMKYAINFVSMLDENFLANKKRCFEFADLMEKEGLAGLVKFGVLGHPANADPQVILRLRDVGLTYISFGAENANQHILNLLNKKSTVEQIQNAIDICIKCEVYPITTWMISPEDTPETVLNTIRFWKRNQITCKPFIETAYPATKLFEDNKEKIIDYFLEDDEKKRIARLESEGKNEMVEEIKDKALERYILHLGDATDLVCNLNSTFNDLEIIGLQELMLKKDERRILKWAKAKEGNFKNDK